MTIPEIEQKANVIRQDIMRMLVEAGSGHSAGPLGMADIFAALYFDVLKQDPKHPDDPDRDRLFLSNGGTSARCGTRRLPRQDIFQNKRC